MRRNIVDILSQTPFNIENEYQQLYDLSFYENIKIDNYNSSTLFSFISQHFRELPRHLIKRSISIRDYNKLYGYNFLPYSEMRGTFHSSEQLLELFITLSEYVYNFISEAHFIITPYRYLQKQAQFIMANIESSIDEIGYKIIVKDNLYIIVPASPQALAVAEIVKSELAVSVFEYNHYRLKGQLTEKLSILKLLADDIEPFRSKLDTINRNSTNYLFRSLNFFIRHNNQEKIEAKELSSTEIEEWYDDIYQMYLLAKLELDNVKRIGKAKAFFDQNI